MNVRNLFVYHCFNKIFKILKFRTPISLFEIIELFKRNRRETRFITPEPSLNFTDQAALIWNVASEVLQVHDFSKSSPKTAIKIKILKIQAKGDPIEWEQCFWN